MAIISGNQWASLRPPPIISEPVGKWVVSVYSRVYIYPRAKEGGKAEVAATCARRNFNWVNFKSSNHREASGFLRTRWKERFREGTILPLSERSKVFFFFFFSESSGIFCVLPRWNFKVGLQQIFTTQKLHLRRPIGDLKMYFECTVFFFFALANTQRYLSDFVKIKMN